MKLIDRSVGRELLVNVLFAILVLSLVLVVGNIFRKLLPLLVNHDARFLTWPRAIRWRSLAATR
ncbi:MAG: hypothetical protein WA183_11420 [Chthoniobacterales bacterium]